MKNAYTNYRNIYVKLSKRDKYKKLLYSAIEEEYALLYNKTKLDKKIHILQLFHI